MAAVTGSRFARRAPRGAGGGVLRQLGAGMTTLALIALGLGAGLWFGSPAAAATPPIQVDMHDGGGFVTSTGTPLLDVAALAPGGSVAGSMDVLDDSDYAAGSGYSDTISLTLVSLVTTDGGPAGGPVNIGSGAALAGALQFTVTVIGPGTIPAHGTLSVAQLQAGITLASGLINGNTLAVSATAALPSSLGNEAQYGQVSFRLAVELSSDPVNGGGGPGPGVPGTPGGTGDTGDNGGQDNVTPPQIDVEGTGNEETAGGDQTGTDIIVLGENKDDLGYTGLPLALLLTVGGGVLVAGVALMFAGRRTHL